MTRTEQLAQARQSGQYAREIDDLQRFLECNSETGKIFWKISSGPASAGSVAGWTGRDGYIQLSFRKQRYQAHRVIWMLCHGRWPSEQIDHINGVRDDNRLCNLRECTRAQNHQNRGMSRNNTSRFTGVVWHKNRKKWKAQIKLNGKNHYLGLFTTPEEAHKAYLSGKAEFHKFQPTPRGHQ